MSCRFDNFTNADITLYNEHQRSLPESLDNSFTTRPVTVHQNNSEDPLSTVNEFFAFSSIILIFELHLFLTKVT